MRLQFINAMQLMPGGKSLKAATTQDKNDKQLAEATAKSGKTGGRIVGKDEKGRITESDDLNTSAGSSSKTGERST